MDDLAQQIIDLTRIVTDAPGLQPGKPVNINVLPGFSTALPSTTTLNGVTLSGNLVGALAGTLTGTLTGVLNTLVDPITLSVRFTVKRNGVPVADTEFSAAPAINVAGSLTDPFNVAFLLKPPLGEDTQQIDPLHYEIDVTVDVAIEGLHATKTITVPVDVPAIPIPALLILGKHANFAPFDGDDAGSALVMVRASSPLRELGTLVRTVNDLMSTLKTLQSVLDLAGDFIDALGTLASVVSKVPTVFFSIGSCPDFDANGIDFESEATSLLLIGVTGTQITLHSDEGYDQGGLDEETSTFAVDEIMLPGNIPSGVGIKKIDSFVGMHWDTDSGEDLNDSAASVRWSS